MNNRATLFLSIVTSVAFFAAGMLLMNFILPEISIARVALDCDSSTISDGVKATCLGVDVIAPYLILAIVSVFVGRVIDNIL